MSREGVSSRMRWVCKDDTLYLHIDDTLLLLQKVGVTSLVKDLEKFRDELIHKMETNE
jgi:hypothetical protein